MDRGLMGPVLIGSALIAAAYIVTPVARQMFLAGDTPRPVQLRGDLADIERTTVTLFERASPSVVQVVATHLDAGFPADGNGGSSGGVGTGTGFLWDAAGHVVTNDHVVNGAQRVAVRTASGQILAASVVGKGPNYDLAVVRISSFRSLPPPLPVGASANLRVGQSVFAIGNPFGLDQTLTTGIISAVKRRLPTAGGREIADVIQTDAAINPGNSGGPLLDSAGRLIGVNTAIISPSGTNAGIGFAIPVDVVNRVVPEIIRTGRVPTPGLGILAASEALATRVGIQGVVIIRTIPGSPAASAGLEGLDSTSGVAGDVIVAIDGKPVRKLADLTDAMERIKLPGQVTLTVVRHGTTRKVTVDVVDMG